MIHRARQTRDTDRFQMKYALERGKDKEANKLTRKSERHTKLVFEERQEPRIEMRGKGNTGKS